MRSSMAIQGVEPELTDETVEEKKHVQMNVSLI